MFKKQQCTVNVFIPAQLVLKLSGWGRNRRVMVLRRPTSGNGIAPLSSFLSKTPGIFLFCLFFALSPGITAYMKCNSLVILIAFHIKYIHL